MPLLTMLEVAEKVRKTKVWKMRTSKESKQKGQHQLRYSFLKQLYNIIHMIDLISYAYFMPHIICDITYYSIRRNVFPFLWKLHEERTTEQFGYISRYLYRDNDVCELWWWWLLVSRSFNLAWINYRWFGYALVYVHDGSKVCTLFTSNKYQSYYTLSMIDSG